MTIAEKLTAVAENVPKVYNAGYEAGKAQGGNSEEAYNAGYTDGQTAEHDKFWDSFQQNGKKTACYSLFAGTGWNDDNYNPKYPINATSAATYMFQQNSGITSTKVPISISVASSSVFNGCNKLKEIVSLKVTANVTFTSWFNGCTSLETINFTEDSEIANNINFSPCTNLSDESLPGIINTLGGTKASTITLPSKFNTDEYDDIIAEKPSNWTISWM